jgi:hypothetical protein
MCKTPAGLVALDPSCNRRRVSCELVTYFGLKESSSGPILFGGIFFNEVRPTL